METSTSDRRLKENVRDINKEGHDPSDLVAAFKQATREDYVTTGIFYQKERSCYEESERETLAEPLVKHRLGITQDQMNKLVAEFV